MRFCGKTPSKAKIIPFCLRAYIKKLKVKPKEKPLYKLTKSTIGAPINVNPKIHSPIIIGRLFFSVLINIFVVAIISPLDEVLIVVM